MGKKSSSAIAAIDERERRFMIMEVIPRGLKSTKANGSFKTELVEMFLGKREHPY
jgi:hypothetical protein